MTEPLKLLLLEDSADDAELILGHLRRSGYDPRAEVAMSEREYLAALDPALDLIVADYSLPGLDALGALELMQARKLDVPFIVVSGTVSDWQAVEALKRGASDYLLKDRLGRLGHAVSGALERKRILDRERSALAELRRLAAIVEYSNDAIVSRDLDLNILSWNAAAEKLFGYTAEEAIGRHASLIVPPEREEEAERCRAALGEGRVVTDLETVRVAKGGRSVDVSLTQSAVNDERGNAIGVSLIFRDISERKRSQAQLDYVSQHDWLTSLPNRNLFRDHLEVAAARTRRRGEALGVLALGLDGFSKFNESLGSLAGDELLRQVAARLHSVLREGDSIARLGGDEFAILVEGVTGAPDVTAVARKLAEALTAPFEVRAQELFVSASIGITVYPAGTGDPQALLENASIAMARAKREGGGGVEIYEEQPVAHRGGRLSIETRLRHALENGELAVHYQPKYRLHDGVITGAEALLRWNPAGLGEVDPAQFIPIAEETGLILPIGTWVLQTACARAAEWNAAGRDLGVSVNLSPRQFRQKDLRDTIAGVLSRTGLAPARLELEITEGTAMSSAERTVAVLKDLSDLRVTLAVDDFGTGYSSLGYLQRFPLHCLKIDRSFVRELGRNSHGEAIVRATTALAHSLDLRVVAEGIETEDQRLLLSRLGCDEGQGFLFSRALPPEEFARLISAESGKKYAG